MASSSEKDPKRPRQDSSEDDSGFMCQRCDYVADKVITCSGCSLSFCLKCANVSKTLHQCIMDGEPENFHWSCRSCKATFPTLQQISSSLQDITGKHDARMSSIENRLDRFENSAKEEMYQSQVNDMKEDIITSLKADINTVVDAKNKELEDRKRRDMNLTVFNLQEHNFSNGPDNKRADENDILRICSSLGLENLTINYSYRLGKKVESKTRPLKLVLDSKAQRKFLLDNARFVPTKADDNYKRVIITKDLTPAQREERREKMAKIRAQRRSNQSSSRNTSPKHSAASMEVDRPLPSPIRPNQQTVSKLLLSQGNPLNDSLNNERSVREPSFMYNQTTVINDTTLTGDRTVMGGSQPDLFHPIWPQPGQPAHTEDRNFSLKPVNLRNLSFNVNNSILHANVSDSLSVLYSNVDCLTQSKKLELEYLLSNKKVDIVALTEIYPKKQLI